MKRDRSTARAHAARGRFFFLVSTVEAAMETSDEKARAGETLVIDEGMFVEIRGLKQWVTVRGSDRSGPVLLIVHGTGFALSAMAPFFAPWERDFTIVQWDQPGAGATYAKNGAAGMAAVSTESITRDGIAVTEFVRQRLGAEKIALLAISGGTVIGLKMVKARPELFAAYVGSGQVVHWARQEARCYQMILQRAREAGDAAAIAELEQIGPPPYKEAAAVALKAKYANAMTPAEQAELPALLAAMNAPSSAAYIARGLPRFDARAVSMATFEKLMGEFAAFDARQLGLRFGVPMFFFQGAHDVHLPTSEVKTYATEIDAPQKLMVQIHEGGHSAFFLREEFLRLLNAYVRSLAITRG
jgi:pimeloyl-ACP methyl ester carboxylesterase